MTVGREDVDQPTALSHLLARDAAKARGCRLTGWRDRRWPLALPGSVHREGKVELTGPPFDEARAELGVELGGMSMGL